jgi:hypothetical protein
LRTGPSSAPDAVGSVTVSVTSVNAPADLDVTLGHGARDARLQA